MRIALFPLHGFHVSILAAVVFQIAAFSTLSAETIPPVPQNHFNDYANVVSDSVERQLNERLAAFERGTSNQVVVAVFARMDSSAPVRDYTLRIAQAWGVGRKDRDNGVVLFAFMQERQLYLQVGVGLEPRIPDSLAQRIINQDIVPRFRARDIDGGLRSGVDAILSAIRAEPAATRRVGAPVAHSAAHPVSTPVEHPVAHDIPVEAPATPPAPPVSEPHTRSIPSSPAVYRSSGDHGGGLFFGFFLLVIIVAVVRLLSGLAGSNIGDVIPGNDDEDLDYDSSGPRRSTVFSRRTSTWDHRPRFGGFGGSGGSGSRASGGGSFSRGGGSFRGGGAGGGW